MLARVLSAPVNLYFDVTPTGRILNRFSKDLNEADNELSSDIGSLLAMVYQALAILLVAIFVVPWILLIVPILAYSSHSLYKEVINAITETARLESLSRSPIVSFFCESYSGASTIRAFKRQRDFKDKVEKLLNTNILTNHWIYAVDAWFAVRVDLITLAICSISLVFCLLYPSDGNKLFPIMLLSYILSLQEFILCTLRYLAKIEKRMVSINRCLNVLTVPVELEYGVDPPKDWPHNGQVVFKNVFLRYRPDT